MSKAPKKIHSIEKCKTCKHWCKKLDVGDPHCFGCYTFNLADSNNKDCFETKEVK